MNSNNTLENTAYRLFYETVGRACAEWMCTADKPEEIWGYLNGVYDATDKLIEFAQEQENDALLDMAVTKVVDSLDTPTARIRTDVEEVQEQPPFTEAPEPAAEVPEETEKKPKAPTAKKLGRPKKVTAGKEYSFTGILGEWAELINGGLGASEAASRFNFSRQQLMQRLFDAVLKEVQRVYSLLLPGDRVETMHFGHLEVVEILGIDEDVVVIADGTYTPSEFQVLMAAAVKQKLHID